MKTPIDDYLETVTSQQFALLQPVRDHMHAALRSHGLIAVEVISYGIPCLKVDGKAVGGFAANTKFCSYYPFSGSVLSALAGQLASFSQTKSALHFSETKPLNAEFVRLLVSTRLKEINRS